MSRTKLFIISTIVSIIVFFALVAAEKTVVKYTPMVKVLYAAKDINRKEALKPEYFIVKEIPITSVTINNIRSINDIGDKFAKENIYSNEPLNKNRIGSQNEVEAYVLNPGEREMAITFDNIGDCVGGTLRKDDKVDIIYTNAVSAVDPIVKTETRFQGIRILEAIDASGKYIDVRDRSSSATTLLIAVTPEQAHELTNMLPTGKIKLIKIPDGDKEYKNITVHNGKKID